MTYFAEDWQFPRHIATICSCPQSRFWLRIYAPSVHWQVLLKVKSPHGMQLDSIVWVRCVLLSMFSGPPKTNTIVMEGPSSLHLNQLNEKLGAYFLLRLCCTLKLTKTIQVNRWTDMIFWPIKLRYAGRTTACLWMEMQFVLLVHILLFGFPFPLYLEGAWSICVGLHLEPATFYISGKGSILAFGIYRCRVRGREGAAFPFPIVKHLISPALVHLLAG